MHREITDSIQNQIAIHTYPFLSSFNSGILKKKEKGNSSLLRYEHYVPFKNVHMNGREEKKSKNQLSGETLMLLAVVIVQTQILLHAVM